MGVQCHLGLPLSVAVVLILFFATVLGSGLAVRVAPEGEEARTRFRLEHWEPAAAVARVRLVGPGSSPPTCRGRCGQCSPCQPVHVAIHPGRSAPMEYYPEAWRCKCGDQLFMP